MNFYNFLSLLIFIVIAVLVGCTTPDNNSSDSAYHARVYRTEGGIPHIVADDFGSLGFGTGYANAQDNFCITAKNILAVRGELSAHLGPDDGNLTKDLFQTYLINNGVFDEPVSPALEYIFAGFAAGFNHYLRTTGIDNLPDPECRGADWIHPMRAQDAKTSELMPAFLSRFGAFFVSATPPNINNNKSIIQSTIDNYDNREINQQLIATMQTRVNGHDKGSNGVAIGKEHAQHQGGLLYTNPHVNWDLGFFFFPRHQIIPGVTNLLGANTYNRSLVGFGTNGKVAWTNTVSTSRTQSLYELTLVAGNPTAYIFDGKQEQMETIEVSVDVLDNNGHITTTTRNLYRTRHGLVLGGSLFPWTENKAFALRVANEGNRGQNGQSIALARAQSVHDIKAALTRYQATSNTNVIAADINGETLYADMGPVANLTNTQLKECATTTPILIKFLSPAFRGDTSACIWGTDPDSAEEGLLGASKQALLIRQDYVTNSNSSYWLANPNAPIEGIPNVQGDTHTERSLRTRSGLSMIQQRINGHDGLPGNTFNINSLIDRMLSNQSYAGQLLRDDLVSLCTRNPIVTFDGKEINLIDACNVLKSWDLTTNIQSKGAHLFREFISAAHGGSLNVRGLPAQFNYTRVFDANDPVNTPAGLNIENNPEVLQALAKAVVRLQTAGIALDAKLGDIQFVTKNNKVIPIHGGSESEGVFNKMSMNFVDSKGYPAVTGSSTSWIMAVELAKSGVNAKGVLSYAISSNKASPRYNEMTEMFAQKKLVNLPFTLAEIKASALTSIQLHEGSDSCLNNNWHTFQQPVFTDEENCRTYFNRIVGNKLTDWIE